MRRNRLTWLAVAAGVLGACATEPGAAERDEASADSASGPPTAPNTPAPTSNTPAPTSNASTMTSNTSPTSSGTAQGSTGTQTAFAALTKYAAVAVDAGDRHFEVALALLPRTFTKGGLYEHEGTNYPATPAARDALSDQVAWTYAAIAQECATLHPEISLSITDQTPSEADLAKTLQAVANCAYSDLGLKPYWIPRLLVDVDVCGRKLGKDWRLPTVADVKSLNQAERAAVVATVREGLYNGLEVFAIAADKTLQVANLETGATRALSATNATYVGDTYHYEGNASLRCVRGELAPLL